MGKSFFALQLHLLGKQNHAKDRVGVARAGRPRARAQLTCSMRRTASTRVPLASPTLTRSPMTTPKASAPSPAPAKPKKVKKAKKGTKKKGAASARAPDGSDDEEEFDESAWLEKQMELTRRMNMMYCQNSDSAGGNDDEEVEEEEEEDDMLEYFDYEAEAEREAARKAETLRQLYAASSSAPRGSSENADSGDVAPAEANIESASEPEFEPFCAGRRAEPVFEPIEIFLSTGDERADSPPAAPSGASTMSSLGEAVVGGANSLDAAAKQILQNAAAAESASATVKGSASDSMLFDKEGLIMDDDIPGTPRSMAQRIALRRQASFARRRNVAGRPEQAAS